MKFTQGLLFIILLMTSGNIFGQKDTSSKKINIRPVYQDLDTFENLKTSYITFDTSLNRFSQLNPYLKENLSFQDLGLLGTPIQGLFLNTSKKPGFDFGFNRSNDWLYDPTGTNDKLIIAPTPYTVLNYAQGAKDLIFLELLHTQNITRRWNIGLDYRRLKTNNYLFYELAGNIYSKIRIPSIYNVKLFTSYRSKLDKYYLMGSITYNKSTLRETGGLSDVSTFDSTSGSRRVFENPLSDASNLIKQPSLFVKQYYRFGKTSFQTELKDSILDTLSFDFKPRGYFYHSILANKTLYQYTDALPDSTFYPLPFLQAETNDSMVLKEISNTAGIVLRAGNGKFQQLLKLGAEYNQYWIYNSFIGQTTEHNLSVNAKIMALLSSKFGDINITGNGKLYLSGYNAKDYLLEGLAALTLSQKIKLKGRILSQRHVADYFQSLAVTNHAQWNQNLDPVYRNGIEASIQYLPLKLEFGFKASNFQNYVLYYNEKAPTAIDFSYLELYLSNHLKFQQFNWYNRISSQKADNTFHLPALAINGGVYLEGYLFKKNMLGRFGVDYSWYSSYFADEYNPYLRQFVWQDQVKIGNYPYFAAYVSAQIKTMNLFVRFEHVNQGFSGNRFYASPNYPSTPRFFRFGVKWRLFH